MKSALICFFIVVSTGLIGQGVPYGQEIQVNTYTNDSQGYPTVAALLGGGFVVCWQNFNMNGSDIGVYGQLYDASGTKKGGEFQVNHGQENPIVAALFGGGFIICWDSYRKDMSGCDVYGQLYDALSTKKGEEFQVSAYTINTEWNPTIAALSGGDFLVCWTSFTQDNSRDGIYGQFYNASGMKKGGEFKINTYTIGYQQHSAVATLFGGDFIVCWESYGQDGSNTGIYAKRFPENPILHKLVPFNLFEPLNDSSIKIANPTLKWHKSSDQIVCYPWELHYKIVVDDNPDFISPELCESDMDTTLVLQDLQPGQTYFWKVLAKNIAGDSLWSTETYAFFVRQDAANEVREEKRTSPDQFVLFQNYPNPFNLETTIRFDLPSQAFITVKIFNINGKLIRVLLNESKDSGSYIVRWDGRDFGGNTVPSGIYICMMDAEGAEGMTFHRMIKMGLIK